MQEAVLPYKTWQQMPRITKPTTSNTTPTSSTSVIFHLQEGAIAIAGAGGVTNVDLIIMMMKDMVKENPVIVFGKKGCCMSHVVKRLLQGLGVNPPVYEIEEKDEEQIIDELKKQIFLSTAAAAGGGGDVGSDRTRSPTHVLQFPAVFIGGELFGGLDRIMAAHITGELTPVLKKAGALWL